LTDVGRLEKDSLGLLRGFLVSLDDETDAAAGSRKRGRGLGNLHRVKTSMFWSVTALSGKKRRLARTLAQKT